MNAVFGTGMTDKLKNTSLFVMHPTKMYQYGHVDGTLVLPGSTASLWATNSHARAALAASLKNTLVLSSLEHVHILNVAEVSNAGHNRALMKKLAKGKVARGLKETLAVAQIDYAIELSSSSSPALVEMNVMGLSLEPPINGPSLAATLLRNLNDELTTRGLPPQDLKKRQVRFSMPTVQLKDSPTTGNTNVAGGSLKNQAVVLRDTDNLSAAAPTASSSSVNDVRLLVLGALGLAGVIVVLAGAYQLMNRK